MKTFSTIAFLFLFFIPIISAQFVYGDELQDEELDEKITTVQPPIAALQPTMTEYTVNAKKGKTISTGVDTKIIIPPNAFVGRNGNIIIGKVDIQYREFKNPLDIFLSGIPMTIEENGKKEFFQSAGMVEFRANQNGEEIFPNPDGEPIVIEISSSQTDKDFNLYTLDENSGELYFITRVGLSAVPEVRQRLTSGMSAEVYIQTESRTFMAYLLKPFSDSFQKAFNEK